MVSTNKLGNGMYYRLCATHSVIFSFFLMFNICTSSPLRLFSKLTLIFYFIRVRYTSLQIWHSLSVLSKPCILTAMLWNCLLAEWIQTLFAAVHLTSTIVYTTHIGHTFLPFVSISFSFTCLWLFHVLKNLKISRFHIHIERTYIFV